METLSEEQTRIIKLLREAEQPLTLEEIVAKSGLDRKTVVAHMVPLVKNGMVKNFLQEKDGKTVAVYVAL